MSAALRISDGATLALHSMALLAAQPGQPLPVADMTQQLRVAQPELADVLRRLSEAGLAAFGDGSMAALAQDPAEVSLLAIYEAIDGPLTCTDCLLGEPTCEGEACILGDLIKSVNEQMRQYLSGTRLADVADAYRARATRREG